MVSTVKRPPATSGRESPTGTPQRSGPKSSSTSVSSGTSSPAGAGTGAGSGSANASRLRPARAATPVSARAAAHERRQSLMSNGAGINGRGAASPDLDREEVIRAESMAIIDDLKERLSQAEASAESYKRQVDVLQSKLDDALKEQARLEERVHESEEQIEALTNEKRDAARQMREMETIYEAERSAMMKEKEEMANREEEMQLVIQRLKDTLAQRNDEDRPSRQNTTSPSADNGSFAPPSSIHRSDSRNNSKLLLQKDKLIESLRLELAEAQIKLVESQNQDGGRLQEVERQLVEARIANARLMEDNESYQLLLQERTLKGDFSSDFVGGASANQDALAALEGRSADQPGTSLADELSGAGEGEHDAETQRRLEAELRQVKDQNKALTLYINKIIERLLQHQGFEHILDQSNDAKPANTNKDLPPPPPPKPSSGPSLLQRAKTVIAGGGTAPAAAAAAAATAPPSPNPANTPASPTTARPKARPMTFMPSSTSSVISNPDTAPSIPIGRTTSVRRTRPMSDQYTTAPGTAASIVNAIYRGPSGADGPLSPSLRTSQTFFLPTGAGNRSSSGGGPGGGNFPGTVRSDASSIASGESGTGGDGGSTPPSQASPPRSHHGHGEGSKSSTTTFAGNKPRPLRLVQENAEATAAQNKRQSWVGWMGSAFGGGNRSVSGSVGGGDGQ
ncbi:hypothetical protein VTJ83DRAFT_4033 [Remersonia thermophila]|uniref:M protein, serotype 2.1 n=1 Tax=Remersonia thermophila TaxID=72144 RepID=A0ABR4DFZ8_9PEZI